MAGASYPSRTSLRLRVGRREGEDGDLWPAQKAEPEVHEPEPPVGVEDHAPHLVEPPGVPLRERRKDQAPEKRNPDLTTVRVARELQIEASGGGAHVGEVRLVGQ